MLFSLHFVFLNVTYDSIDIENYFYQEPPPPPPEPPPAEPPPDELPELLDGLEVIALCADFIVEFIKDPKDTTLNVEVLLYQEGDCNEIVSNFLIHFSETPSTYV